jgi:hypothetical protein
MNERAVVLAALCVAASAVQADEVGHFNGGIMSIRDYVVPEDRGFYAILYNYGYTSSRLNDRNGDKRSSVTINPGPGPGVTLGVKVDVDLYAAMPAFMWVTPWEILGAKYAAYVAPTFANQSIHAELAALHGSGRSAEESQFGAGDLFAQPVWLGWGLTHFDLALGYGFYAPVGRYHTETFTLPVVGPVKTEDPSNIGLGFWTHQFQGGAAWYPWKDKRMAITGALTYEIHGKKEGFDIRPGEDLTFNWGISQYLPLSKDEKLLLEVGPAGYDSWQVTDETGTDARNRDVMDRLHAVGGQVGVTYLPWSLVVNFHGFYEYASVDRFQGASIGLNIAKKF